MYKENYICGHVHVLKMIWCSFVASLLFDRILTLNFMKLEFMEKKKYTIRYKKFDVLSTLILYSVLCRLQI